MADQDKKKVHTITKFTITKVFEGSSGHRGDEAKTPWQIVNFYIDHPKAADKRFTKFCNPDKANRYPYVGAKVKSMKFTLEKSGKYENLGVTEIEYMPGYEPDTGKEAAKIKNTKAEAETGDQAAQTFAGDPMPFDEKPQEPADDSPVAPVEEVTDTAPPGIKSAHILGKCIESMTKITEAIMLEHAKAAKTKEERTEMLNVLAARELIGTHAVLLYDEILKGLERWQNGV